METRVSRRTKFLGDTLRRFVRRGSRSHISKLVGKVRPEDVAILLRGLTPAERQEVFEILLQDYLHSAGDMLTALAPSERRELLERLEPERIAGILEKTEVDDAVFLLEGLPDELKAKVLEIVDLKERAEVEEHLTYEDDTAGRIMTTEFFALPESTTVREAISAIQEKRDVEMVFYLYVVDHDSRLVGVTSLRRLLLTAPDRTLGEMMQRDIIEVHTSTDQEEVAQLAAHYDLLAIPVVDEDGRLVGIVTVDDIVDVVKEEATEDFFKMAGTSDDELLHEEHSFRVARIRLPWLLINLVGLVLTGMLLNHFQVSFAEVLFLITFVPAIMGMGGNTGTQTATITVRGLATGRLDPEQLGIGHYLLQQAKIGALMGVVIGVVVGVIAYYMQANLYYGAVVATAMFLAVMVASMNGVIIPLLFQKLGLDPAVASAPLVTTSNDITGILIYFGVASLLIDFLVH